MLNRSAGLLRKRFVTGVDASNKKWQVMVSGKVKIVLEMSDCNSN